MRILEQKGYVRHEEEGRAYVYIPLVQREEASSTAVSQLLNRFFGNSPAALALKLVENKSLDQGEIARLKALIEQYEEEGGKK
jgi:predicted transcriptional regulator